MTDPAVLAAELADWLVGVAFGRFDLRLATGERAAPPEPGPFDPLPVCSPGMLTDAHGLPAARAPDGYPLDFPADGILVDDAGLGGAAPADDDIVRRVEQVLGLLTAEGQRTPGEDDLTAEAQRTRGSHQYDQDLSLRPLRLCGETLPADQGLSLRPSRLRGETLSSELCALLGVKSLREYFGRPSAFFADHLGRHSKSRRKAPLYWPLATESGSYALWLYYPRLTDQILYSCVNDHVDPKLREVERDLQRLRGTASGERKTQRLVDELVELERELKALREELLRVAHLPYRPDQNDGVLISAAPLWRLFRHKPWQKELKVCWEELEAGKYDWAHLAMAIWPERVREACRRDRSIAIAHGLEGLYEG